MLIFNKQLKCNIFTCQVLSRDGQSHSCEGIQRQVQFLQNKILPCLVVKDRYFSKEMHNHPLRRIPLQDKDVSKKRK